MFDYIISILSQNPCISRCLAFWCRGLGSGSQQVRGGRAAADHGRVVSPRWMERWMDQCPQLENVYISLYDP